MKRSLCAVVAAWFGVAIGGCSSESSTEQAASAREPLSGGEVDGTDLAVGMLFAHAPLGSQPPNTTPLPSGVPWVNESCTGNLISPDIVLTAGHCFDVPQGEQDVNPHVRMDSFYVGQGVAIPSGDQNWEPAAANMQKFTVDAFVRPSGYAPSNSCPPSDLDIAVAHLATPVPGVTPLGIATSAPPAGASVTTIGFGRHPTPPDGGTDGGITQCCAQTCVVDCTCLQTMCGCKNLSNFGGVCTCNDPTIPDSYEQLVRRTATVTIAEVLPQYLHQTDVSHSGDLPGDSGGAVLYNGVIVGTDDCGNGCVDAQTDQYFVRMDVAHDWIVSQVTMFDGDSAAGSEGDASGGSGTSGSTSSGSSSGAATGSSGSGSSSGGASGAGSNGSSGSTGTSGSGSSGGSSTGGFGGASGNGSGGVPEGDSGGSDNFGPTTPASGGCGCVAAGADGSPGGLASLFGAGLLAMGALARRTRRAGLVALAMTCGTLAVSLGACAGSSFPGGPGDDGDAGEAGSGSSSSGGFASSSGSYGSSSSGTAGSTSSSSGTTNSSSSGTSSGADASSGGIPGFDGGLPGFDGGYPGFDGGYPGWDGGFPDLDGGIPGFDGSLPGFDF